MVCKKCGIEIPEDAVICPACGADISDAEVSSEEIIEEVSEIAEEASETVEEISETVDEVLENTKKTVNSKKLLWVIVSAVIAVVIAAAAFIGISNSFENKVSTLSEPSAVAKIFGAKEEHVSVYMVTKKDNKYVYAKTAKGEEHLVRKLMQNESFEFGSECIVKGNKVFFMNDEGGLSVMNVKNGKINVIGDDFKAGTMSFSKKGDYLLYTGEDFMLYKSKNGKEATKIEVVGDAVFSNQLPSYGFVNETNDVWYATIDNETKNANLYLESGDAILEGVTSVFHVADKGNTVVYSKVTKEETIEPEVKETADGEQKETNPKVVKTYALMLKEGDKSVVLNDNYATSDSLSILNKDIKGVLYISEKGEVPVDEKTGSVIGSAAGKLYFHEFGGETKLLEENVELALILDDLKGTNYFYDASDRVEDETILYMKEDTICFMKDFKKIENPKDFEFLSSSPVFADNNQFILYKTFESVQQPEIAEGDATDDSETEQAPAPAAKLVYASLEDGKWSDYTVVAEDVQTYQYNEDTLEIYYTLNEKEDLNKLSLYAYSLKDGKSTLVVSDVLPGYIVVDEDGVFVVNNYNTETQFADIVYYNGKKTETVAKDIAGFISTENGTVYTTKQNGESTDLYILLNNKLKLVCENFVSILFVR